MTATGFIILFILITIGALVFIELAGMPGRDARKRNHPKAEAISILGWLGLPLGVFGWLAAMVWARSQSLSIDVIDLTDQAPRRSRAIVDGDGREHSRRLVPRGVVALHYEVHHVVLTPLDRRLHRAEPVVQSGLIDDGDYSRDVFTQRLSDTDRQHAETRN